MQKKLATLLLLVLVAVFAFGFGFTTLSAQQTVPVIHAESEDAYTLEGDDPVPREWYLTPEAKPDVYDCDPSLGPVAVALYTDIDSFKTVLQPGESTDLIVLLNGKDSCFTRFRNPLPIDRFLQQVPASHDTMALVLTEQNNLIVKTVVNGKFPLDLKFDSGAIGLVLKMETIRDKTDLLDHQPGVKEGTAEPNWRRLPSYNQLQIGNLTWDSLRIWPTRLSGQGSEGRFGWDLFEGRVLEIDYDKGLFIVHSSLSEIPEGYAAFDLEYHRGLFRISGDFGLGGMNQRCHFLFDNGYQRAILADSVRMQQQGFPMDLEVVKRNELRNGQGHVFYMEIVKGDRLAFEQFELTDIPVQVLKQPNPAGYPTHILGGEILKRFNTIIDFRQHKIYLQPNGLSDAAYVDANW